jgi:CheY-like chemotaxis protein
MKKILLVDDQQADIFALNAVLRSKGFACLSAVHVSEAIELLKSEEEIGLVILDMVMPEKNGHVLMPIITSKFNVPVIAVTAEVIEWDREACLAEGAADYLTKPIDTTELIGIIGKHINPVQQ